MFYMQNMRGGQGSYPYYKPAKIGEIAPPSGLGMLLKSQMSNSPNGSGKSKNSDNGSMMTVPATFGEREYFMSNIDKINSRIHGLMSNAMESYAKYGSAKRWMNSEEGQKILNDLKMANLQKLSIEQDIPTMDANLRNFESKHKKITDEYATDQRMALKIVNGKFVPYSIDGAVGTNAEVLSIMNQQSPLISKSTGRVMPKNIDLYSGNINGKFQKEYLEFAEKVKTQTSGGEGASPVSVLWANFIKQGWSENNYDQVETLSRELFSFLSTEAKADIADQFYNELYSYAATGEENDLFQFANKQYKSKTGSFTHKKIVDEVVSSIRTGTFDPDENAGLLNDLMERYTISKLQDAEGMWRKSNSRLSYTNIPNPERGLGDYSNDKGAYVTRTHDPIIAQREGDKSPYFNVGGQKTTPVYKAWDASGKIVTISLANQNMPISTITHQQEYILDINNGLSYYDNKNNKLIYSTTQERSDISGHGILLPNGDIITAEEAGSLPIEIVSFSGLTHALPDITKGGYLTRVSDFTNLAWDPKSNNPIPVLSSNKRTFDQYTFRVKKDDMKKFIHTSQGDQTYHGFTEDRMNEMGFKKGPAGGKHEDYYVFTGFVPYSGTVSAGASNPTVYTSQPSNQKSKEDVINQYKLY